MTNKLIDKSTKKKKCDREWVNNVPQNNSGLSMRSNETFFEFGINLSIMNYQKPKGAISYVNI